MNRLESMLEALSAYETARKAVTKAALQAIAVAIYAKIPDATFLEMEEAEGGDWFLPTYVITSTDTHAVDLWNHVPERFEGLVDEIGSLAVNLWVKGPAEAYWRPFANSSHGLPAVFDLDRILTFNGDYTQIGARPGALRRS